MKKLMEICREYEVSSDLTKWRNQKYFSTWQGPYGLGNR